VFNRTLELLRCSLSVSSLRSGHLSDIILKRIKGV